MDGWISMRGWTVLVALATLACGGADDLGDSGRSDGAADTGSTTSGNDIFTTTANPDDDESSGGDEADPDIDGDADDEGAVDIDGGDETGVDDGAADGTCHRDQLCEEGSCYTPDTTGVGCGGGDCTPGDDSCVEPMVCTHDGECGATCAQPCEEGSCSPGFACTLRTGVCTPLPCPEEWACPADYVCDPEQVAAGAPGCVRRTCVDNEECDGLCVNGRCYDTPGFCADSPPP